MLSDEKLSLCWNATDHLSLGMHNVMRSLHKGESPVAGCKMRGDFGGVATAIKGLERRGLVDSRIDPKLTQSGKDYCTVWFGGVPFGWHGQLGEQTC